MEEDNYISSSSMRNLDGSINYFYTNSTAADSTVESDFSATTSIAQRTLFDFDEDLMEINSAPDESKFRTVFRTDEGFKTFRDFLTNIFMQLDEDKFEGLMRDILSDQALVTDEQIYDVLSKRIGEAKKGIFGINSFGLGAIGSMLAALRSLGKLKGDLAEQVKTVMGKITKIDGYLEIGYPGRMVRPIQGKLKMNGPIIVVNDGEDIVQRGFPFTRPYNKIVPLKDYQPISKETAADASLDMVSCFIGLHHIEDFNTIDRFVRSIHRVLRPGGTFILMDHNADTKEMKDLCWVVHSVFNAATGETSETEKNEFRGFDSIRYWKIMLGSCGFELVTDEKEFQVRAGDPTKNTVLRFRKKPNGIDNIEEALNRTPGYVREQWKTFSSIPEWYNVDYSKGYADSLQSHDMNQFSYLKHIVDYWKVFANSWNAAREHSGFWELMASDFIVMDLFIGVTMTMESVYRAIASTPLALLNSKSRQGATNPLKIFMAQDADEYSKFINHTPFYNYPYFKQTAQFWTHFIQALTNGKGINVFKWNNPVSRETLGNLYQTILMSVEYMTKGVASAPIAWMYGSGSLKEPEKIGMLIDVSALDEDLNDDVDLIEEFEDDEMMHVENPRYIPNTKLMVEMSNDGVKFINIAGQKQVAVKVAMPKGTEQNQFIMNGCKPKFAYTDPTDAEQKYLVLDVEVAHLDEVLNFIHVDSEIPIKSIHVHDF